MAADSSSPSFTPEPYDEAATADWLVCTACGTQFPSADRSVVTTCHICDDPRQYVPPSGQSFTTLAAMRGGSGSGSGSGTSSDPPYRNVFTPYAPDPRITFITTAPKFAIGQRAALIRTPAGTVLWDCLTLLDAETVRRVRDDFCGDTGGRLAAIVISHPHYYSTHVQWARAFACPVYLAAEDRPRWTTMASAHQVDLTDVDTEIPGLGGGSSSSSGTGARALKLGGHFPGSLVLLFDGRLFIADTLVTTPAGLGRWEVDGAGAARAKPEGLNTFSFLWSIPNAIPLGVEELARMWAVLGRHAFRATHGAFAGMDIEDEGGVKGRVLESMQIQARFMGYGTHAIMKETA